MTVILWVLAAVFAIVAVAPLIFNKIFNEGSAAAIIFAAGAAFCAFFRNIEEKCGAAEVVIDLAADVLLVLLCVAFAAGLIISLPMLVAILRHRIRLGKLLKKTDNEGLTAIIILGCRLVGESPTGALKRRVDLGLKLLNSDDNIIAVVSGGQGSDEKMSEAVAMRNYITEKHGIDMSRIITEDKSSTTYENLAYSMPLINEYCKNNGRRLDKIIIVSDGFHLFRANLIARKQGIEDVCCAGSVAINAALPVHWIRELLAVLKFFMLGK